MTSVETVCHIVGNLEPIELEAWVRERWILPEGGDPDYVFHEVDVARVRLICELRREMAIDEEAMPLVLRLLDQVYALRYRLRALSHAVETLPPESRAAVRHQLAAAGLGEDAGAAPEDVSQGDGG